MLFLYSFQGLSPKVITAFSTLQHPLQNFHLKMEIGHSLGMHLGFAGKIQSIWNSISEDLSLYNESLNNLG